MTAEYCKRSSGIGEELSGTDPFLTFSILVPHQTLARPVEQANAEKKSKIPTYKIKRAGQVVLGSSVCCLRPAPLKPL